MNFNSFLKLCCVTFTLFVISDSVTAQCNYGKRYSKSKSIKLSKKKYGKKHSKKSFEKGLLTLEIYGGASLVNKSLEAKNNSSNSLLNLRKESESPLETIQLGLGLNYQFNSGITIASGLNFSKVSEKFQSTFTSSEIVIEEGITGFYINNNLDTIFQTGPVEVTKTTDIDRIVYNQYQLLDAYLLFGYSFPMGQNWSLGGQAGIFANVLLKADGNVLSEDETSVSIDQSDLFKPHVGISYHVGLKLNRSVGSNLNIFVNPFFRYYSQDFSSSTNPISQRYSFGGINLGLAFALNN